MTIAQNVRQLLEELPPHVELVAAAKTRTPAEVIEAVDAGVTAIGQNYLNESERVYAIIGQRVKWHFIGRLQKNKIGSVVSIFDIIETLDSLELAAAIDRECALAGKMMPVLVEVNSGNEPQKSGVIPAELPGFIARAAKLKHIKIAGLMTMGPLSPEPEDYRPYFATTRQLFEMIKELQIPRVDMRYLSMGMTDSYRVAIEEGANMIRIGSKLFGPRI
ncbi:MAG: YggS family pyridoxal phosphate-dependent enzyme [Dehalococcoidaceae bacterium]|nr:YggS family pyridoxal phosphate-dependent enzyme [Dehalococcoidaceae bacterium]